MSAPEFTKSEEQQLKEWLADGKQWMSVDEAIGLIKDYLKTTVGHAQKILKEARASGEVRYANDDGIANDPRFDSMYRKDDLLGYLDRQFGKPKTKPAPAQNKQERKPRTPHKKKLAQEAIKAEWPEGIPDGVSTHSLCSHVTRWLREHRGIAGNDAPGDNTILRAAGRK
jgi:hypothetical protein